MINTQNTTISASTTETTIVTAGASGVFNDLVTLIVTSTSAVAVRIDFRDVTAGTIRFSLGIAGNGGAVIPFGHTIPQTTAANNWTAQCSASVTDIRIYVETVQNK